MRYSAQSLKPLPMRYIDNPDLTCVELTDLRGAVNLWRKAQYIPCRPRSSRFDPSVAAARHIADSYPHLAPDLVRLADSRNPCLAFFSYLTLVWIGSEFATSCRERLRSRRFPVLDGCFLVQRDLASAIEAAELHLKLHGPP